MCFSRDRMTRLGVGQQEALRLVEVEAGQQDGNGILICIT